MTPRRSIGGKERRMNVLNYEHRKTIDALRRDGYAVLIFSPEELDGVAPQVVERALRNVFNTIQDIGKDDEHTNDTH